MDAARTLGSRRVSAVGTGSTACPSRCWSTVRDGVLDASRSGKIDLCVVKDFEETPRARTPFNAWEGARRAFSRGRRWCRESDPASKKRQKGPDQRLGAPFSI